MEEQALASRERELEFASPTSHKKAGAAHMPVILLVARWHQRQAKPWKLTSSETLSPKKGEERV